jgi:hypothetical protein
MDGFVARYSPDGHMEWVTLPGGPSPVDHVWQAVLTPLGKLLVAGNFKESITVGEGRDAYTVHSKGSDDYFLASLTLEGAVEWLRGFGSAHSESRFSLIVLEDGSPVVGGTFEETLFFSSQGDESSFHCDTESCCFAARFNSDGELSWAETYDELSGGTANVSASPSDELVLTGMAEEVSELFGGETPTVQSSDNGIALLGLNPESGEVLWSIAFCTPTMNTNISDTGNRVSVFSNGQSIFHGTFSGNLLLSPYDETSFASTTGMDFFISLIGPDKDVQGLYSMGGTGSDEVSGSDTLGANSIHLTGMFTSTTNNPTCFGTGNDDDICLDSEGTEDIFLMRLVRTTPLPD